MSRFELITHIAAPPERCFDASRDIVQHVRSFTKYRERAIAGVTSGLIGAGEEVVWEGIHFGFRLRHHSRINAFEPRCHFQDQMVRGVAARSVTATISSRRAMARGCGTWWPGRRRSDRWAHLPIFLIRKYVE
jgi:hypothetical protein